MPGVGGIGIRVLGGRGGGGTVLIMPTGDSLTRGLNGDVGGYRKPLDDGYLSGAYELVGSQENPTGYFHEGNGGETMAQMSAAWAARWAAHPGGVVLLQGGTNDAWQADAATALTNLDTLLTTIEATAPVPSRVLVSTIPPSNNAVLNAKFQTYNAGVPGVLAGHALAELVDFAAAIDSTTASMVIDPVDGIHMREYAYADWAHIWANTLLGSTQVAAVDAPVGATLQGWWRADTVTESGGKVTGFTDKSGNGRDATQADAAKQLTRSTGALGQDCVTGNGAGWYRTANFAMTQPTTVICVAKISAATYLFDGIGAGNRHLMYTTISPDRVGTYAGVEILTNDTINGVSRIFSHVFNSAASIQRGAQQAIAYGDAGTNVPAGITLCATAQAPPTFISAGSEMYEWAIYSGRPLNLRAIEQGLKARYGI